MRRMLPLAVVTVVFCTLSTLAVAQQKAALEQEDDRVVLDALLDALGDPDALLHKPAGEALVAMGPRAVDAVASLLRSENADAAVRAADVLSSIGDRRAMAPLARMYHDADDLPRREAAIAALAAIARASERAPANHGPAGHGVAIDGQWSTNWGPMSLDAKREGGVIAVTGGWDQGPGMHGSVTRGTFDPATGIFEFDFDEPWHAMKGTASLKMSADGRSLSGTWQFTTGGGGSWTMQRPDVF